MLEEHMNKHIFAWHLHRRMIKHISIVMNTIGTAVTVDAFSYFDVGEVISKLNIMF